MPAVHWLQPRRRFDRLARWLEILTFALVGGTLLAGLAVFAWVRAQLGPEPSPELLARQSQLLLLLLVGGVGVLLLLPIVWPVARALERRVGTDGSSVYLRLGDGREWKVPAKRVVHTRQAILNGPYSFPLRNQQGKSFYREGEVETHLEPLLQGSAPLGPWQGLRYQWANRDSLLLWPLGAALAMLLLLGLVALLLRLYPVP